MAYGRTDKNLLRRAVPVQIGLLTGRKVEAMLLLRTRYISAADSFSKALDLGDPLLFPQTGTSVDALLLPIQKNIKGLNKAYVEKARIAVKEAFLEHQTRYLERLCVAIRSCAMRRGKQSKERPSRFSTKVHQAVQEWGRSRSMRSLLNALRVAITGGEAEVDGQASGLIKEIHAQHLSRWRCPRLAQGDDFVCQIHFDNRLIRHQEYKDLKASWGKEVRVLVDESNAQYQTFVEVSNPVPRGPAVRLPVTFLHATLRRHVEACSSDLHEVSGVILEIGRDRVGMRLILSKPPPEIPPLNQHDHLIGRDYGYRNTLTLAVVKTDTTLKPERLRALEGFSKDEMKHFLKTHAHPSDQCVERIRFNGKGFIDLLNDRADKVNTLKAERDRVRAKATRLKVILNGAQDRSQACRVEREQVPTDPLLKRVHQRVFRLLEEGHRLKRKIDQLWASARAIKKSWFGYLSNQEIGLVRRYNAVLVREALTLKPLERKTREYKGRRFNRMLSHGARSHYERVASEKLEWWGRVEIKVQSAYTSTCCVKHSRVDKTMRNGDHFQCPDCATKVHADEHAAETIALLPLLMPLL